MHRPVILLFGGTSSERRVSVASAQYVAQCANAAGIPIRPWFWAPDDAVYTPPLAQLLAHADPFQNDFCPAGEAFAESVRAALDQPQAQEAVVFVALHGVSGEDGTLQGWLEARQLDFTASGALASHRAFDKSLAKRIVAEHGVAVAAEATISGADLEAARATLKQMHRHHARVVLKPVAEGSSTGLQMLATPADIATALSALAANPKNVFLVEPWLQGAELTVGVRDTPGGPRALPCSEVRLAPGRRFDFAGKYLGQGSLELTPAEVSPTVSQAAQQLAITAHQALGCYGYSRTDIIVTSDGPVFLELNTLPGLTRASFIPQQLEAARIPFTDFIAEQLALAERRDAHDDLTAPVSPSA